MRIKVVQFSPDRHPGGVIAFQIIDAQGALSGRLVRQIEITDSSAGALYLDPHSRARPWRPDRLSFVPPGIGSDGVNAVIEVGNDVTFHLQANKVYKIRLGLNDGSWSQDLPLVMPDNVRLSSTPPVGWSARPVIATAPPRPVPPPPPPPLAPAPLEPLPKLEQTMPSPNHVGEAALPATSSAPEPLHTSKPLAVTVAYAGFWKRFAALLIDGVVFNVIAFSVMVAAIVAVDETAFFLDDGTDITSDLYSVVGLLAAWIYAAAMESSSHQATLGKMALGIRVVDMDGSRISFGKASGRYFGKVVSFLTLGIGYLMAAFTRQKQALHDMMAGCLVVDK